jgi:hypothetical protein
LSVNLIDPRPIEAYLDGFLPSDPQAASLLKQALTRGLSKRSENMQVMTDLPEDAPEWLKSKWPRGGPYHQFKPDGGLDDKVRHVADWLKVAVQDREEWIDKLDGKGRVQKLVTIASLEQACDHADKAMHSRNRRLASQLVPDNAGEETVTAMAGGFRMVRLLTVESLDRESVGMGHCIGQGSYDKTLKDGSRQFFSLRDCKNQPHATLEVDTKEHSVLQCQGKENKPPVERYLPYLQQFIEAERFHLKASAGHTGLIEHDAHYYSIHNLPANLEIKGNLDLSEASIKNLPERLKVGGELVLSGTRITELPKNLQVDGDLYLHGTRITQLPDDLKVSGGLCLRGLEITKLPDFRRVGGNLDLSRTNISQLPDGLEVGGSLYLDGTKLTHLPKGLKVVGNLDLDGTNISQLPDGLEVGGHLNLSRTKITQLPKGLKVVGNLDLDGTNISQLPDGMEVGGSLCLGGTKIAHLPKGLKVGGNLDLSETNITRLPSDLAVKGNIRGLTSMVEKHVLSRRADQTERGH